MKKQVIFLLMIAALMLSCAGSDRGVSRSAVSLADFSDAEGKEWKLVEVHVESAFGREILFDRNTLIHEGFGDLFTVTFDGQTVSGTASPNLYSAPYTLGEGQSITILPMRSTLMASLFEPEKLREHTYFLYMQNVYEWRAVDGNLILLSKTEDGYDVQLVFSVYR